MVLQMFLKYITKHNAVFCLATKTSLTHRQKLTIYGVRMKARKGNTVDPHLPAFTTSIHKFHWGPLCYLVSFLSAIHHQRGVSRTQSCPCHYDVFLSLYEKIMWHMRGETRFWICKAIQKQGNLVVRKGGWRRKQMQETCSLSVK